MVTDLLDKSTVSERDFVNVRSVDDEFTAIRHDGFKLVHAFAADPEFIVHWRRTRKYRVERMLLVSDMQLPGQVACLIPSVLGRTRVKACQFCVIHHHAEAELRHRYHRAGVVHDFAHRSVLVADDHWVSDHRAKPVKEVQHFGPAHARKQVFVTAGKPNDFVRKNRPGDDDLIILKKPAIDIHWHVHREQAPAQMLDLGGGNDADIL